MLKNIFGGLQQQLVDLLGEVKYFSTDSEEKPKRLYVNESTYILKRLLSLVLALDE